MEPTNSIDLCRASRKNPTEAEEVLWEHLRAKRLDGYKFRRQHPLHGFILDFYCAERRLAIEVDGAVHRDHEQSEYDQMRSRILGEMDIEVIRFWNSEVTDQIGNVVEEIRKKLAGRRNYFLDE
jgi:very-short-patch-repair endonuclease